jgi:thiol:disulfide interchange protein DsbD
MTYQSETKILVSVTIFMIFISIVLSGCFENGDEEKDQSPSSDIPWMSYENALLAANNSSKPILVDFYADWCGPCREMDKKTYTNEKIIELSLDFECAKVNVDDYPELGIDYGIEYIPTTVFLSPNGEELNRIVGFIDANELTQEMINVKNMMGNNTIVI